MTIDALLAGYRDGSREPADVVAQAYEHARSAAGPAWISLVAWSDIEGWLARLKTASRQLPLYGVPFAIKDNIDLAGTPTTAACPAFAYTPRDSAFVVRRLIAAGAIPIGKTNMDQFATGLTGTRTPYGACASVADPRYISGGSSSGSAVAVADGTVPFALATDTAGSGRVPAAFNAIVGVKPSLGLIGTTGVVPACRGLDCVSLLSADVAGARRVLAVAAGSDPGDPYSRAPPRADDALPWGAGGARIAIPHADQMTFCGDEHAAAAWEHACTRARALGWQIVEIDFAPFAAAASQLYDGPWVAERFASVGRFVAAHQADVDPNVRDIIMSGRDLGAVEVFEAKHQLARLALRTGAVWERADALLLPTAPTVFTAAEIADEPIARTAQLGTYTNFVNLLDLCAVAVPAGLSGDGQPFGVSLIAPAGADATLLTLAAHWRDEHAGHAAHDDAGATVELAVVGAHLSGEPLNGQLLALGARLVDTVRTAPTYRLFDLPDATPAKPGLVGGGPATGTGIEVEIWELATELFGRLVAGVAPPLAIGTIALADGRTVKGFICEADAVTGAREITAFGGWRAYRATAGLADASGAPS